jgi:ketosteroid isomerase-like protein
VGVVSDLTLEQFRTGYLEFQSAFNRGDFASAFAVVAPDCEFQWIEEMREDQVKVGREEIIGVFEDLREMVPDWRFETAELLPAADDVFVTLDRGRGRGRGSGVPVVQELASVHRIRDGLVVRVRQYASWEQGLKAAGLDPAQAADVRRAGGSAAKG